jgi:hypothetical protein
MRSYVSYGLSWEKLVDVSQPSVIDQFNEESQRETSFVGVQVLKQSQQIVLSQLVPVLHSLI